MRNFLEALLSGVGGGLQEYGAQTRENDLLNLRRRDAVQQFLADMMERRKRDAQSQANADRLYNLEVEQNNQRNLKDYMTRTLGMLEQGAADVATADYRRDVLTETGRHNRAMEANAAARVTNQPSSRPASKTTLRDARFFANPFGNRMSMATGVRAGLPLAQFSNPAKQAPLYQVNKQVNLDEWGAGEYGDDWQLLSPEQKQALARKNGVL